MDADPQAPVPWLVTGFVDGPSLAQVVMDYGPLPVASVLALAAGLAEGLGAVHAAGVVHRDLKPSNVLLAHDGPRVIDFGIAQAADATQMTGTGMVIGSPGFMSPEQAEGSAVGAASDVFSLGAVLVFAATGEGPFGGGTAAAQLYRVVHSAPHLDQVPSQVRPLAERCLAKDPAQRPSASQFLAELTAAHPAAANLTGWLPESLLAASPSLPAVPGLVAAPDAGDTAGPGTPMETPAGSPASADPGNVGIPEFSAPSTAGPSTVTAAAHPEPPRSAGPLERQAQVPDPQDTAAAASRSAGPVPTSVRGPRRWSRTWLLAAVVLLVAVIAAGSVLALSGDGGKRPAATALRVTTSLETILKDPDPNVMTSLAFGSGEALAVGTVRLSGSGSSTAADGGTTYVWDAITGELMATLTDPGTKGVYSAAFAPGGTTLATSDYNGNTYLWDLSARKITTVLKGHTGSVAFEPGGTTLAIASDLGAMVWDTATGKITTLNSPEAETPGAEWPAFGPGGTLAIGDAGGKTYVWDIATRKITATLSNPGNAAGQAIAFGLAGTTLAAGNSSDSRTYLRDVVTGKLTATLADRGKTNGVWALAFGPGGTILAAGDGNGTTYLWDLATRKIIATLTTDKSISGPDSAAFGPGGTILATEETAGRICLWHITVQPSSH